LFTAPLGENDIKVAFSGSRDDHKEFGTLIRASDGQVLWSGPLLVNGVFPILKEVDGNTYEVSEPDKWLDVSRTVAMGGDINIFSRVTRLEATDMDESTVQRLVKAKAQLVPSLTRLEVLRVHARELANAARRSFERP
jgi:hypothetical protein